MQDIRVSNWEELNAQLYAGSWRPELRRHRLPYAFRGMPDSSYTLRSSLLRLSDSPARMERHLLRNFRKYARSQARLDDSLWGWLALAQHHGLPTRLLDWTYSPYVALHFATVNAALHRCDCVVWAVDYVGAQKRLPAPLRRELDAEEADVFTAEMLGRAVAELAELERMAEQPFVLFFEPPSLDDRIINQMALFALMSRADAALDDWLVDHPDLCRRIVIPANLKDEVRDKLDQANITERVLMPGLDGLCRWLTRYYSPRPDERTV
ncbi:MAG TPA: FRG domain-containing protein [Roseiflexaceae bacterium]|nr:FRG domain-containing protein [Roseiflexaceae bacterium]